jgi:hypothetical protein
MDSHHLGTNEAAAAKFFDYVFVAHKQYLPLFDSTRAYYLPCSFSLTSATESARYLAEASECTHKRVNGVCAPFTAYPLQKRNRSYAKCLREIKVLGIENSFFGVVRGGARHNEALITKMLQHKVVLNLSLADDLNMRNFESLALNRILLTNRVLDHELFTEWEENIVYLDENMDNLGPALIEALNRTPKDISKQFLVQHGIQTRVLRIIEILSGHRTEQKDVGSAESLSAPALDSRALDSRLAVEIPHSQVELLAKSGWISINSLLSLLKDSKTKSRILADFGVIWSKSFGVHILQTTIGRRSFIRAVLKILGAYKLATL